jgi:hypothetical protein
VGGRVRKRDPTPLLLPAPENSSSSSSSKSGGYDIALDSPSDMIEKPNL